MPRGVCSQALVVSPFLTRSLSRCSVRKVDRVGVFARPPRYKDTRSPLPVQKAWLVATQMDTLYAGNGEKRPISAIPALAWWLEYIPWSIDSELTE